MTDDPRVYTPRLFISGLGAARLLLEGDQAPNSGSEIETEVQYDFINLEGDQGGALLLEGDQA